MGYGSRMRYMKNQTKQIITTNESWVSDDLRLLQMKKISSTESVIIKLKTYSY